MTGLEKFIVFGLIIIVLILAYPVITDVYEALTPEEEIKQLRVGTHLEDKDMMEYEIISSKEQVKDYKNFYEELEFKDETTNETSKEVDKELWIQHEGYSTSRLKLIFDEDSVIINRKDDYKKISSDQFNELKNIVELD